VERAGGWRLRRLVVACSWLFLGVSPAGSMFVPGRVACPSPCKPKTSLQVNLEVPCRNPQEPYELELYGLQTRYDRPCEWRAVTFQSRPNFRGDGWSTVRLVSTGGGTEVLSGGCTGPTGPTKPMPFKSGGRSLLLPLLMGSDQNCTHRRPGGHDRPRACRLIESSSYNQQINIDAQ
jgi:hypothetical protein